MDAYLDAVLGSTKRRIEKATYGEKGVQSAQWNAKNQLLTITFESSKTTKDAIAKRIMAAGHDVASVKAADKAYAKLPECCKYRDGVEIHDTN